MPLDNLWTREHLSEAERDLCTYCGVHDQSTLSEVVEPNWTSILGGAWRLYIPSELKANWSKCSLDQKLLAYRQAQWLYEQELTQESEEGD